MPSSLKPVGSKADLLPASRGINCILSSPHISLSFSFVLYIELHLLYCSISSKLLEPQSSLSRRLQEVMEPFMVRVSGGAEIPHPAQRALIDVVVSSSGSVKAAVSDEVLTTARHVEALLGELSPTDDSPEAKQAAPLAHWSKTSLSATSYIPDYDPPATPPPRQYDASINFDIRFKEFKALGAFGAKLSALSHVEVQKIRWILTNATEKSFRSRLRKEAARDALTKAQDYCEVLGCAGLRPIELEEFSYYSGSISSNRGNYARASQEPMQVAKRAAKAPAGQDERDERDESPLEFRPEEVKMTLGIQVKFHAE